MNEYRIFLTGDVAGAWKRLVGRYYWLHDNNIIAHLLEMHNLWCKEACPLDLSHDTQTSGSTGAIEKPDLIPSASISTGSELRNRLQGNIPTESVTRQTETQTNSGQYTEQNGLIKEEPESMEFTESVNLRDDNSIPLTPGTRDPGGGGISSTGEETPTSQSELPVIVSVESLASVGQHHQDQQPVGQQVTPGVQQPVGQQVTTGAQQSVIRVPGVRLFTGGQQLLLLMKNGQNTAQSVNTNTAQLVNQSGTQPVNQSSSQSADSSTGNISKDIQGRKSARSEPVSSNLTEQDEPSTSLGDDPQTGNQFSDAFHAVAWDTSYEHPQPRQYIRQCHYNCLCCAKLQLGYSCSCNTLRESCGTQTLEYDTLPQTIHWENLWKKGTYEHSSLQKLIMNAIDRYNLKDSKDRHFTTAVNDIMTLLTKADPTLHQSTHQTTCNTEKKVKNRIQKALEWRRYYSKKRSSAEDESRSIRSNVMNKKPKETDKENL